MNATDLSNAIIFCESKFIGNIFGYRTNIQWIFNVIEWLDDSIHFYDDHPLHNLSVFDYRALMRDLAKALDENWSDIYHLNVIEDGLLNSLKELNFDDKSTLVINIKEYEYIFDDVNQKLANGDYFIK